MQDQTYRDFKLRVGIEPAGPDAFDENIRRAFEIDERFEFLENDSVLGWAGNIDNLITGVDTEFFAILPHDDFWHEDFLTTLLPVLDADRAASVAYSDMQRFGVANGIKFVRLDNSDISTRLLSFYREGAEAVPWRGVTRQSVLSRSYGFPQHKYMSYAVECEYAQHLICSGKAIRISEPLYNKRTYNLDGGSVSKLWVTKLSEAQKRAALELHRARMLAGIPPEIVGKVSRETIVLSCEIAMLRRTSGLSRGQFGLSSVQRRRVNEIRFRLAKIEPSLRRNLLDYLETVLVRIVGEKPI